MQRADSKPTDSTCQGINRTTGRMCRRAVSPAKQSRYCHLHDDQVRSPHASPAQGPLVRMASTTSLYRPAVGSAQVNWSGRGTQTTDDPTNTLIMATTRRPAVVQDAGYKRSFLSSLFTCLPRKSETPNEKAGAPSAPIMRVARKPVIMDEVLPRTSEMELMNNSKQLLGNSATRTPPPSRAGPRPQRRQPDTRPARIAQDYAEILELTKGLKVQSDARPSAAAELSSSQVHPHVRTLAREMKMTLRAERSPSPKLLAVVRDLEERYLDPSRYSHVTKQTYLRICECVRSAVIAAPAEMRPRTVDHFIYLYRGSGDYTWTPLLLCKIGRARQPLERMYQWRQQCGRELELLDQLHTRFDVLVERLVHLELADRNTPQRCDSDRCGKLHREWFSVPRDGAKHLFRSTAGKWIEFAEEIHKLNAARDIHVT
ncbi:hypothetical protein PYCC9005_000021 [Savitreella phatthalungensis]